MQGFLLGGHGVNAILRKPIYKALYICVEGLLAPAADFHLFKLKQLFISTDVVYQNIQNYFYEMYFICR